MKLETFFNNFDQLADTPDAVAKVRELIRTFAVQGKLVSQNPKDEPAEDLITRVSARLPTKQSDNPFITAIEPGITDDSQYDLPPGWAWLPLGHTGIWASGCGFPKHFQGETEGEFLFCKVSDMNLPGNEVEIRTTVNSIDADVMKKIRARANPVGTVIFPKIGGAIATHKRRLVIKPTIIDNNCSGIQPIGLTDNRWLLLLMRSIDLTRYQSGTSVPAVSQGSLDPIRIGLPPLAEQKRIVAKVDELMGLCDRLEAQQQERETWHAALSRASLARFADAPTPANLAFLFHPSCPIPPADLRKSILTLAIQGKLVPQDPNDKPAEEILASGAELPKGHVRRRKIMKRAPIASKAEMFPDLPSSWAYADVQTLYDLNLIVDYADGNHGSLYPRSSEFGDSGVKFVTARDIARGRVSWDGCALLNEDRAHQLTKGWAQGGDVLLTHNATVGRVARVERDAGKFLLGTSVTFYRLNEGFIDSSYFYYVLCSPTWQGQLEAIMEQTTRNQVSIQKQAFFRVPLSPLAEQRRIVATVNQLMALVDELETHLAASRATVANLLSALVAELTDQPILTLPKNDRKRAMKKISSTYLDSDYDLPKAAEPISNYGAN